MQKEQLSLESQWRSHDLPNKIDFDNSVGLCFQVRTIIQCF